MMSVVFRLELEADGRWILRTSEEHTEQVRQP